MSTLNDQDFRRMGMKWIIWEILFCLIFLFVNESFSANCTEPMTALVEEAFKQGFVQMAEGWPKVSGRPGEYNPCYVDLRIHFKTGELSTQIIQGNFKPPLEILMAAYNSLSDEEPPGISRERDRKWNHFFGELNDIYARRLAYFIDNDRKNDAVIAEIKNNYSVISYIYEGYIGEGTLEDYYKQFEKIGDGDSLKKDSGFYTLSDNNNLFLKRNNLRVLLLTYYRLGHPGGAMVSNLLINGPGEKAGLKIDDVVVAIDGKEILDREQLIQYFEEHKNRKMSLLIERDGQYLSIDVFLSQDAERYVKYEKWKFTDEYSFNCYLELSKDRSGNPVFVVPAKYFSSPDIPGIETQEKILLSALNLKNYGIFQTLPQSKWHYGPEITLYFPVDLIRDQESRSQVIATVNTVISQIPQDNVNPIDIFVHNNSGDGQPEILCYIDYKNDGEDNELKNLILYSPKNYDLEQKRHQKTTEDVRERVADFQQTQRRQETSAERNIGTEYPSVNPVSAAIVSFVNAGLFEFGDELYCEITSDDNVDMCREKARTYIKAYDHHYPWITLIFAVLGYIALAPTAWLYIYFVRSPTNARDAFNIFFWAEGVENAFSIIGQTLTYQNSDIFFLSVLIAGAAATLRGGCMAFLFRWNHETGFRFSIKALAFFAVCAIIYFFIMSSQAHASVAGSLGEIFERAAEGGAIRSAEHAVITHIDDGFVRAANEEAERIAAQEARELAEQEAKRVAGQETRKLAEQQEVALRRQEELDRVFAENEVQKKAAIEEQRKISEIKQKDEAFNAQKKLDEQHSTQKKEADGLAFTEQQETNQKWHEQKILEDEHFFKGQQEDLETFERKQAEFDTHHEEKLEEEKFFNQQQEELAAFEQKKADLDKSNTDIKNSNGDKAPDFVVSSGGTAYPVPKGAHGPEETSNLKGTKFTGGDGGSNNQVDTIRIMDPVPARGNSPEYPNGYIKYENSRGQGVDPYTGKTLPNTESHFPIE